VPPSAPKQPQVFVFVLLSIFPTLDPSLGSDIVNSSRSFFHYTKLRLGLLQLNPIQPLKLDCICYWVMSLSSVKLSGPLFSMYLQNSPLTSNVCNAAPHILPTCSPDPRTILYPFLLLLLPHERLFTRLLHLPQFLRLPRRSQHLSYPPTRRCKRHEHNPTS
jgi:hypothetical protein